MRGCLSGSPLDLLPSSSTSSPKALLTGEPSWLLLDLTTSLGCLSPPDLFCLWTFGVGNIKLPSTPTMLLWRKKSPAATPAEHLPRPWTRWRRWRWGRTWRRGGWGWPRREGSQHLWRPLATWGLRCQRSDWKCRWDLKLFCYWRLSKVNRETCEATVLSRLLSSRHPD